MKDQNKRVERDMLSKIEELSLKLRDTLQEKDALLIMTKEHSKTVCEMKNQIKDTIFYSQSMEKENMFLR